MIPAARREQDADLGTSMSALLAAQGLPQLADEQIAAQPLHRHPGLAVAVLAKRHDGVFIRWEVGEGVFGCDRAKEIASALFYDNPSKIFDG